MKINDQAKGPYGQCKIVGFNEDKSIYDVIYVYDKNKVVKEKAEDLKPLFKNLSSESLKRTAEKINYSDKLIDPIIFSKDCDIEHIEEVLTMNKEQIIKYKGEVIWKQDV